MSKVNLVTTGSLTLNYNDGLSLADLEEFCAKARELGLADATRVDTSRQGMLGPINGLYISIPVIPKKADGQSNALQQRNESL